jgi:thiol-disulfide isomerase/thioredoxin
MNRKLFKAVLLGLCLWAVVCPAQKSLTVGDTLPPELWNLPLQVINHPEGKSTITLADYKDKLIILDFWATTCAPCVTSLIKLDTLRHHYVDNIAIIPVTREPKEKISDFLLKRKLQIGSVIENKSLSIYFPHRYIPHCIWISEGKIISVTDHKELTPSNFKSLLTSNKFAMPQKQDLTSFDATKPIFSKENGVDNSLILTKTTFSRPIAGLNRTHSLYFGNLNKKYNRIFAVNSTIAELYSLTDTALAKLPPNRIIIQGLDNSKILRKRGKTNQEDLYCYERTSAPATAEALRKIMQNDLDNFFNLTTYWETKNADCYILTANSIPKTEGDIPFVNIYDEGQVKIINQKISLVSTYLNHYLPIPVINEIKYKGNIDIILPNLASRPLAEVIDALNQYGINLTMEKRDIKFFIITTEEK